MSGSLAPVIAALARDERERQLLALQEDNPDTAGGGRGAYGAA